MALHHKPSTQRSPTPRDTSRNVATLNLNLYVGTESRSYRLPVDSYESDFLQNLQFKRRPRPIIKPISQNNKHYTDFNLSLAGAKYASNKANEIAKAENINQSVETKLARVVHDVNGKTTENRLPPLNHFLDHQSFLSNEFGFNQHKSDTFLGLKSPIGKQKLKALDKQIAVQAKRHLYACSNVGAVRHCCRANQSVLSLKQTLDTDSKKQCLEDLEIKNSRNFSYSGMDRWNSPTKLSRVQTRAINRHSNIPLPKIDGLSVLK